MKLYESDDYLLLQQLAAGQPSLLAQMAQQQQCWLEIVPGIDSLALKFDPHGADIAALKAKASALLTKELRPPTAKPPPISLPICYEQPFALDRQWVAEALGVAQGELADWHSVQQFEVEMLGFLPGFAYLRSDQSEIAQIARLANPRQHIAAGSLGILGAQNGLYALDGPGGWPIIGRVATRLFDPSLARPALLQAGQKIHFQPVSMDEFERLQQRQAQP